MPTLYSSPMSPNCKRVRVLAAELGLPLTIKDLDLAKGEQKASAYLVKNPNGKVPTLDMNGRMLWESPAILYELASAHPKAGLIPTALPQRAEALRWMFWNASHLEPRIFAIAFERWFKPKLMNAAPDETRVAEHLPAFATAAGILNQRLDADAWVLGPSFSIADIALGTSLELAEPAGLDLKPFPQLQRWMGRLAARASWTQGA